jgi:hypothetical protein
MAPFKSCLASLFDQGIVQLLLLLFQLFFYGDRSDVGKASVGLISASNTSVCSGLHEQFCQPLGIMFRRLEGRKGFFRGCSRS